MPYTGYAGQKFFEPMLASVAGEPSLASKTLAEEGEICYTIRYRWRWISSGVGWVDTRAGAGSGELPRSASGILLAHGKDLLKYAAEKPANQDR